MVGVSLDGGMDQAIRAASSNGSRGERGNSLAGSPWPRLTGKLDRIDVPAKNAASTLALSKPDIGPVSRPRARAARLRYDPRRLLLRRAMVSSVASGLPSNQEVASTCGNR